jgi:hypothetical protein
VWGRSLSAVRLADRRAYAVSCPSQAEKTSDLALRPPRPPRGASGPRSRAGAANVSLATTPRWRITRPEGLHERELAHVGHLAAERAVGALVADRAGMHVRRVGDRGLEERRVEP